MDCCRILIVIQISSFSNISIILCRKYSLFVDTDNIIDPKIHNKISSSPIRNINYLWNSSYKIEFSVILFHPTILSIKLSQKSHERGLHFDQLANRKRDVSDGRFLRELDPFYSLFHYVISVFHAAVGYDTCWLPNKHFHETWKCLLTFTPQLGKGAKTIIASRHIARDWSIARLREY